MNTLGEQSSMLLAWSNNVAKPTTNDDVIIITEDHCDALVVIEQLQVKLVNTTALG